MSDPLHLVAAVTYADTRPRQHDCPNCDRLYRTIEQMLALQQIEQGTPPQPDPPAEHVQYRTVPDSLEWLAMRHPNLWWLITLPTKEQDWYRPHRIRLALLSGISLQEIDMIFDPNLYLTRTA